MMSFLVTLQPDHVLASPHDAERAQRQSRDQPMFWLDGLDIPIVQFLDAPVS